ncbi:MAG: sigma-70 family RNA polymerase sigma factor [Planctomycetota bacterium]|nr:MAG: sigma-70 family RNA polymerase sigma factor [Planctomycetota bacterium]
MGHDQPHTSSASVEAALARVQGGDVNAYAEVVERLGPSLVAYVAQRCPPQIDPEEIAHEALVEAYQHIDDYRLGTSFLAWLCTIARHRLIDACRQLRRHERKVQRLVEASLADDDVPPPDMDEQVHALRRCLQQLDDELRQAIESVYSQRKDLSDTARHARRSVSQISRRLAKARELLRACVQRHLQDGGRPDG